ncbi:MAG: ABC transporter ATP-binding protein [Myxococcaceae bacterium]|nr:ABC transporter ATP-binding protein [Myxococcaceae bacterium]
MTARDLPSTPPRTVSREQRGILLSVRNLKVHFPVTRGTFFPRVVGYVRAVDGVSFEVARGETLALVGESGCGKSTVGRALLRLVPAAAGRVEFEGEDLLALKGRKLARVRRNLQMIFQDPFSSLNPRMTVGRIIAEPLRANRYGNAATIDARVHELMALCGLSPRHLRRYPHEFSGGQRQRIAIARALALSPAFIVADEPLSALDVSIRAQIMNLLVSLQRSLGLTMLFISHDLAAVRHLADRVAVMYLGRLVELAPAEAIYARPAHPYTRALMASIPVPDPAEARARPPVILQGEVPSPTPPPPRMAV